MWYKTWVSFLVYSAFQLKVKISNFLFSGGSNESAFLVVKYQVSLRIKRVILINASISIALEVGYSVYMFAFVHVLFTASFTIKYWLSTVECFLCNRSACVISGSLWCCFQAVWGAVVGDNAVLSEGIVLNLVRCLLT